MRALLLVLDSVGIGDAPDAADFGDRGAATLPHILEACPWLRLVNLASLGLAPILDGATAKGRPRASFGRMTEVSRGKDSTTGHWELAGVIREKAFGLFTRFPAELIGAVEREAGVRFLGNFAASGTQIIEDLGPEHLRTGSPILYTSADSVLQIAAHEAVIPVSRLYEICRIARRHADPYDIARVIARPFVGSPGHFQRTAHRHDFSIQPPPTLLDALVSQGVCVRAVGKVSDLFAGRGISCALATADNQHGMREIAAQWRSMKQQASRAEAACASAARTFLFANLVDFDTEFGHRRDVHGYAAALDAFDRWLGQFMRSVAPDDLVIITADHGNDPTFLGTDHTREQVPLLVMHRRRSANLGTRLSFADVAASVAAFFDVQLPAELSGVSFLPEAGSSAPVSAGASLAR